jgi:SAM-dependent methyltransferase
VNRSTSSRDIPCPLCGSGDYCKFQDVPDRLTFHIERAHNQPRENAYRIVACSSCGFLYLNPRPLSSDLKDHYSADSYDPHRRRGGGLVGLLFRASRRFTTRWKATQICRNLNPGSLLDVGCGTGEFMVELKRRGWQVTGIEISTEAAAIATERGCEVLIGDPAEIVLGETFDLITLWHSLEHLPDLRGAVTRMSGALKPGGHLAVALPNPGSVDALFYGSRWVAWDAPRHLYHFSPADLNVLFAPLGLQLLRKKSLPLDPFYHALLSEVSWSTGVMAGIKAPRGLFLGAISFLAGLKPGSGSSNLYIFNKSA